MTLRDASLRKSKSERIVRRKMPQPSDTTTNTGPPEPDPEPEPDVSSDETPNVDVLLSSVEEADDTNDRNGFSNITDEDAVFESLCRAEAGVDIPASICSLYLKAESEMPEEILSLLVAPKMAPKERVPSA